MNKKIFKRIIFILTTFLGSIFLLFVFSLGTQDILSSLENNLSSKILELNETETFIIEDKTEVEESAYRQFLNKFYHFALASKFADDLYLEVASDTLTASFDFSILESIDKPLDSNQYIAQGYLPIIESETVVVDNYRTHYHYLSSTNDAIYLPEVLANRIVDVFNCKSNKDILYSENSAAGYSNNLSYSIKSKTNENISFLCKARGVYSSKDKLGKNLESISNKTSPLAIASFSLIDNAGVNANKYMVFIKPNNLIETKISSFFDLLDTNLQLGDAIFDFSIIYNENLRTNLQKSYDEFRSLFYVKYNYIFVALGFISLAALLFFVLIFFKKTKIIDNVGLFASICLFICFIFLCKLVRFSFIFPTSFAVYILASFYLFLLFMLLSSLNKKYITNIKKVFSEFHEVNI